MLMAPKTELALKEINRSNKPPPNSAGALQPNEQEMWGQFNLDWVSSSKIILQRLFFAHLYQQDLLMSVFSALLLDSLKWDAFSLELTQAN